MEPELIEHQLKEEKRLLEIEQTIKALEEKIDVISSDVSDLVSAWKAASWLVSLIKWVSGLAVAGTTLYQIVKGIK